MSQSGNLHQSSLYCIEVHKSAQWARYLATVTASEDNIVYIPLVSSVLLKGYRIYVSSIQDAPGNPFNAPFEEVTLTAEGAMTALVASRL